MKKTVSNIWMVSREYGDIAGAGGVKDVAQQLSESLATCNGVRVSVVLPLYGFVDTASVGARPLADPANHDSDLRLTVDMTYDGVEYQEKVRVLTVVHNGVVIYLLESKRFQEKSDVYTYTAPDEAQHAWQKQGSGHYDYFAMNVLLQKSALSLMVALGEHPEIVHCHDGHTALLPPLLTHCYGWRDYFRTTGVVVTIHNAGIGYHQEVDDLSFAKSITGLPQAVIDENLLGGAFDPFLAASSCSVMNTVSENYARELQYTDDDFRTGWLGHELKLRGLDLEGITNGIDPSLFDPAASPGLTSSFSVENDTELLGKNVCKRELLEQLEAKNEIVGIRFHGSLSLPAEAPLFTFIARLGEQKGIDLLLDSLPAFLETNPGAQVLLQGSGGEEIEEELRELVMRPEVYGRIMFVCGYSPQIAKSIYAAGDFFVIPSLYEPCGLTDFIAQLHGNIPIVHHVGGLVKVIDGETGIAFKEPLVHSLLEAFQRAMDLYDNKKEMRRIQKGAIKHIKKRYTWKKVMSDYVNLYRKAVILKRDQLQGDTFF